MSYSQEYLYQLTEHEEFKVSLPGDVYYAANRNKEGQLIPLVDREILISRKDTLLPISSLPEDVDSIVEMIISSGVAIKTLDGVGLRIGSKIIKESGKYYSDGSEFKFSRELSFKVIVRLSN